MSNPKIETAGEALYQGGPVECSSCHAEFTPVVYETGETTGIRVAFDCPECKRKFVIAHIDKRGLEIRAQLVSIGRQSPTASMSVINERVRMIRVLKRELKGHVRR